MKRSSHEIAALIAAALMRGPCSLSDLCVAVGYRRQNKTTRVRRYVDKFKADGTVYIAAWWRASYPMWQWQAEPFKHADAEKPACYVTKPRKSRAIAKPATVVRIPARPASVFSMGAA